MQAITSSTPSLQARNHPPLHLPNAPAYALIALKLREVFSGAHASLNYKTPFECLVAAILLAQSTEAEVNSITPALFSRFPTVHAMAHGNRRELESLIRSTGFYRQKAKYLQLTCQMLILHHNEEIPDDIMTMTRLPGVARKTANFVMAELYNKAEGIVVDMRVRRVVQRLNLAVGKSAEATENKLMEVVPQQDWIEFPRLLIELGDTYCTIQNPRCKKCPLQSLCPSAGKFETQSEILPS